MAFRYVDKWIPATPDGRVICDSCGWQSLNTSLPRCRYCDGAMRAATQTDMDLSHPRGTPSRVCVRVTLLGVATPETVQGVITFSYTDH